MNYQIKPWAKGPFELITHAEIHYRRGEDYDRRLALISFDNSIEVSITSFLSLNPIQRNGIEYSREDVQNWNRNFHSKLDFFETETERRSLDKRIGKDLMVWYHDHRNEQYHGGSRGIPEQETLDGIRDSAIWVFSVLFDVSEVEILLQEAVLERTGGSRKHKDENKDKAIDDFHGLIGIAGSRYYTSEVLFSVDPDLYYEIGNQLLDQEQQDDSFEPGGNE